MEHLRGVVERITYQNAENGYSVIRCRVKNYSDLVTVVGSMPEVHVGSVLSMGGNWRVDPKYGRQFSLETFEETLPATVYGIEKYLGSGLIKGIGPKFAGKIVKEFGKDVTVSKRNTMLKERLQRSLSAYQTISAADADTNRMSEQDKVRTFTYDASERPAMKMAAEPKAAYGSAGGSGGETPSAADQSQKISHEEWLQQDLFLRISKSNFRSRFHLSEKDKEYVRQKGMDTIRSHAQDFIAKRLAPAVIPNDGKQTPMRGHPVFIAQHATGCCCRGCLFKWHGISAGHELTLEEQTYVVNVLMEWIRRQMQ